MEVSINAAPVMDFDLGTPKKGPKMSEPQMDSSCLAVLKRLCRLGAASKRAA